MHSLPRLSMHAFWKQTCLQLMPPTRQLSLREMRVRADLLAQLGDGCVYCGDAQTSQDHFRPVVGRRGIPTGYCSDLWNIVPCCTSCNSSKGNRHWNVFLRGVTPRSPRGRRVKDWKRRENVLRAFEAQGDCHVQQWDVDCIRSQLAILRRQLLCHGHAHRQNVEVLKTESTGKPTRKPTGKVKSRRTERTTRSMSASLRV